MFIMLLILIKCMFIHSDYYKSQSMGGGGGWRKGGGPPFSCLQKGVGQRGVHYIRGGSCVIIIIDFI